MPGLALTAIIVPPLRLAGRTLGGDTLALGPRPVTSLWEGELGEEVTVMQLLERR